MGTTLHTTAHMEGTILCATAIDFQTGSSLNGKALAQTAVTLDAATIVTKVARRQLDENPIQTAVNLGTAGDFVVLTKSGVTTTGVTKVTGNMGTSPIAAAALTGFDLIMDSSNTHSTSKLVTGQIFAAGRVNPDELDLGAGIIEGQTLAPGLYKWGSNVGFTSLLTFDGEAVAGKDPVWILQMTGDLIVGAGAIVTLSGDAKAENIFWQVAGSTTLHTTAEMKGTILCATAIDFQTGSSLNGRALAQTAVTLDAATIE